MQISRTFGRDVGLSALVEVLIPKHTKHAINEIVAAETLSEYFDARLHVMGKKEFMWPFPEVD